MGSYKGIVCVFVCVRVCLCQFVCVNSVPPPYKLLSEAQRLDVTLPPWLWWRCGCRMRERKWWVEIQLPSGSFASENSECGWQNRLTFAFDGSLRHPCFWEICTVRPVRKEVCFRLWILRPRNVPCSVVCCMTFKNVFSLSHYPSAFNSSKTRDHNIV